MDPKQGSCVLWSYPLSVLLLLFSLFPHMELQEKQPLTHSLHTHLHTHTHTPKDSRER